MKRRLWTGVGLAAAVSAMAAQPTARVSAPQGLAVSIYDSGYALYNEVRTFELVRGLNVFDLSDVPLRLLPATLTVVNPGRDAAPELVDCGWMEAGGDAGQARPRLRCRLNAAEEGPMRLRLLYGVEGMSWRSHYVLVMREGESAGTLSVRVAIDNRSGRNLEGARVRLTESERGAVTVEEQAAPGRDGARGAGGLRYLYGQAEPQMERLAASPAYAQMFEVPREVSVDNESVLYVALLEKADVPVKKFYVYDGVKLDRFEKNPRNDWNYGTAQHPIVDSYLEIGPVTSGEAPVALPRGRLTVTVLRADGSADILGYGVVRDVASRAAILAQMGAARGLRGTRERVSYTEVTPFREYEESFAVRIQNDSSEDVEVRVVEHLYRAPTFEIVKADTEYTATVPQTIEFRPVVKAGASRVVNYTVRYRW